MANTFTSNYSLVKPEPGLDNDAWGIHINSNLDTIDTQLGNNAANTATNTTNIATNTTAITGKVSQAGDTMTGALTLPSLVIDANFNLQLQTSNPNIQLASGRSLYYDRSANALSYRVSGTNNVVFSDTTIGLYKPTFVFNELLICGISPGDASNMAFAASTGSQTAIVYSTNSTPNIVAASANPDGSNALLVYANGNVVVAGNLSTTGTSSFTGAVTVPAATTGAQPVQYQQFPATLGTTGTTTLPNGLIMKWGDGSISSGSGTVTFGTAFPTTIYNVQVTITGAASPITLYALATGALATTGFSVYGNSGSSAGFNWIAYGH